MMSPSEGPWGSRSGSCLCSTRAMSLNASRSGRGAGTGRSTRCRRSEDDGVERAEAYVEVVARLEEGLVIARPVEGVGEEEPAEEHHLLREEEPDAELDRGPLLTDRVEMVREKRVVLVAVGASHG